MEFFFILMMIAILSGVLASKSKQKPISSLTDDGLAQRYQTIQKTLLFLAVFLVVCFLIIVFFSI